MKTLDKLTILTFLINSAIILSAAIFSGIQHPMEGIFILECIDALNHDLTRIFIYDKNPLTYLPTVFLFKLFGISKFIARIPAIISSFLILISTYLISKELFNKKTALWSLIISGFNPFLFFYYKTFISDIILTGFFILSILFLIKYCKYNSKKFLLLSIITGLLAVFTKQPGFILMLIIGLTIILKEKNKKLIIIFLISSLFFVFILFILNPDVFIFIYKKQILRAYRLMIDGITKNTFHYIKDIYNITYYPTIAFLKLFALILPLGFINLKWQKKYLPLLLTYLLFGAFLIIFPFAPYYALPISSITCVLAGRSISSLIKSKNKIISYVIISCSILNLFWNKIIAWPILYFIYVAILFFIKKRKVKTNKFVIYMILIIFITDYLIEDFNIIRDNTYEQASKLLISNGIKHEDIVFSNNGPIILYYLKRWDVKNYTYVSTYSPINNTITNILSISYKTNKFNQLINKFLEENKSVYFVFERVALEYSEVSSILNRTINLGNITSKHVHPERDLLVYKAIK
ncbi:MAG: ArnT family glycosyltransferase [Candidatus Helarchaeota archaeon]